MGVYTEKHATPHRQHSQGTKRHKLHLAAGTRTPRNLHHSSTGHAKILLSNSPSQITTQSTSPCIYTHPVSCTYGWSVLTVVRHLPNYQLCTDTSNNTPTTSD
ncbi:hypothetical protein M3J09_013733 [Ascochyta lentis]